jgi:hypothetical protein
VRKWLALLMAAAVLLTTASCSLPFKREPLPEEPSSVGNTFVITTCAHLVLEKMMECVSWYDKTLCAMQYVGTRANYKQNLESLRQKQFSQIDKDTFMDMKTIDTTGDDVFLMVPRFDLETFSVFEIAVDTENKTHVLRLAGESKNAFLLICDAGDKPNAQVNASLSSLNQNFQMIILRDETSGDLKYGKGFQPIKIAN